MSLISGANMYPGHQAVFFVMPEPGSYPYVSLPSAPTPVAPTNLLGYYQIPEVTSSEGSKVGYGAGSPFGMYDVPGSREHSVGITTPISNTALLIAMLNATTTGNAEFGTPDYACFWGTNNPNAFMSAIRFCKLNSVSMGWQEGSAQELTAALEFWGVARNETITPVAVSLANLQTFGSPLTWHNFTSIQIAGTEYRDQIMGMNFSMNYNLERKGHGTDGGDDLALSRTAYAIMPHYRTYTFEMTLHSPQLALALVNATSTATVWSSIVLTASNGTHSFTLTINNVRLAMRQQHGGDASGQMSSTVTAAIRGTVVAELKRGFMDTDVLEQPTGTVETAPPIHTVIQSGTDGELRAYAKGSEPPIVMMPNARNPFPLQLPTTTTGVAVPPLQAAPTAPEPDPNSIEGMAKALGLREAEDMDDRTTDAYTSWIDFKGKPLFFFDLDDAMKAEHTRRVLAIEKSKVSFSKPPPDAVDMTPEQIEAMLEAKSQEASSIGAAEVALYDWVWEAAYRGCSSIRDWRRKPIAQRKAIAEIILRSSTVGQNDYQVLTLR